MVIKEAAEGKFNNSIIAQFKVKITTCVQIEVILSRANLITCKTLVKYKTNQVVLKTTAIFTKNKKLIAKWLRPKLQITSIRTWIIRAAPISFWTLLTQIICRFRRTPLVDSKACLEFKIRSTSRKWGTNIQSTEICKIFNFLIILFKSLC